MPSSLRPSLAIAAALVVALPVVGIAAPRVVPARSADLGPSPTEPCSQLLTLTGLPDGGRVTTAVDRTDSSPAYCAVEVTVPDASDPRGLPGLTHIDITLPDKKWNGKYMAEGGGVYAGQASFATDQLAAGYVASTTDTGHTGDPFTSEWVIDPAGPADGSQDINWNRVNDFGYLSLHYMAEETKAVIKAYYGAKPKYSYWNGCSTGGRQGLSEAENYPTDFNGILAGAPALDWTRFQAAQMWPQFVMLWSGDELPSCKESLVNTTLKKKCKDQDGKADGVFDPRTCNVFGVLKTLIGKSTACGTFTAKDAQVVREIWQGPRESRFQSDLSTGKRVWFGLEPGTDMGSVPGLSMGATVGANNGSGPQVGVPFVTSYDHWRNWVKRDASWTIQDETYAQLWDDIKSVRSMYGYALDVSNPAKLKAFHRAGGKLLMWQGMADQLIFTGDSVNFYNKALRTFGGISALKNWFRYFMVPSVSHCGTPGAGSVAPTNPMQQVIDWVEKNKVPTTLAASGSIGGANVTRPICPYPDPSAKYIDGDWKKASSYACSSHPSYDDPTLPGPAGVRRTLPSDWVDS
jgi:hypothetical protein